MLHEEPAIEAKTSWTRCEFGACRRSASRILAASLVFGSSTNLLAQTLFESPRTSDRLVVLDVGLPCPSALDLGGPSRNAVLHRRPHRGRLVVVERLPTPGRRPTPPVEWPGVGIAVGTSEGLWVRMRDGTSRTSSIGAIDVRPVLLPSGELLAPTREGFLVRLDRRLRVVRREALASAARASPLVLDDGSVVVTTIGRRVVRLGPDFEMRFDTALGPGLALAPALLDAGRIVVVAGQDLYVLDLAGTILSRVDLGDRAAAAPVVADGRVHVLLSRGVVAVLVAGMRLERSFALGGRVFDQGAVLARSHSGDCFAAVPSLGVVRLSTTGETRWIASADAPFHGPIAVDTDETTFAFDRRGRLLVFSPSGALEERVELGGVATGFPLVGSDGSLWVTTDANELVRIGAAPRPQVESSSSGP